MREHKYKAYDTKTGLVSEHPIVCNGHWYWDRAAFERDISNKDDPKGNHLVQFTGLKDCKGVEIFEDDLYRLPMSGDVVRVVFRKGAFMQSKYGYRYAPGGLVIGNIHQNPELLEGE